MSEKQGLPEEVEQLSASTLEVEEKWQGTSADRALMQVMGRPQQLRRNFHSISILGFGCVLISTWEIIITYEHLQPKSGAVS